MEGQWISVVADGSGGLPESAGPRFSREVHSGITEERDQLTNLAMSWDDVAPRLTDCERSTE